MVVVANGSGSDEEDEAEQEEKAKASRQNTAAVLYGEDPVDALRKLSQSGRKASKGRRGSRDANSSARSTTQLQLQQPMQLASPAVAQSELDLAELSASNIFLSPSTARIGVAVIDVMRLEQVKRSEYCE
jgi:hypothetical protein